MLGAVVKATWFQECRLYLHLETLHRTGVGKRPPNQKLVHPTVCSKAGQVQ